MNNYPQEIKKHDAVKHQKLENLQGAELEVKKKIIDLHTKKVRCPECKGIFYTQALLNQLDRHLEDVGQTYQEFYTFVSSDKELELWECPNKNCRARVVFEDVYFDVRKSIPQTGEIEQ